MSFSDTFVWGVSTASYQIEGAAFDDGRGPSVWDMFSRKPGATFQGDSGDEACDHYHRYAEDVRLMGRLGVGAYRLSISWPRVMPEGTGKVEPRGLAFYDRLVDKLLESGIQPWVTLFHWDYPLALHRRGGWLNASSPEWFAEYARVIVDALSDRVSRWMTLNEPQVFIGLGYQTGTHAPGDKLQWAEVLRAVHHTLLAHGMAVETIRSRAKRAPLIGMAPACSVCIPASASAEDIEAARKGTFAVESETTWHLAWWLDPVFLGRYPEDGLKLYGDSVPPLSAEQLELVSQPLDFFGMNIYHGKKVRAGKDGQVEVLPRRSSAPITSMKWPIEPECLYWGPRLYQERYGRPVVVTENGLANQDSVMLDGKVHDPQRIDYLHRHLLQYKRGRRRRSPRRLFSMVPAR